MRSMRSLSVWFSPPCPEPAFIPPTPMNEPIAKKTNERWNHENEMRRKFQLTKMKNAVRHRVGVHRFGPNKPQFFVFHKQSESLTIIDSEFGISQIVVLVSFCFRHFSPGTLILLIQFANNLDIHSNFDSLPKLRYHTLRWFAIGFSSPFSSSFSSYFLHKNHNFLLQNFSCFLVEIQNFNAILSKAHQFSSSKQNN